jgi:hypothetical protein
MRRLPFSLWVLLAVASSCTGVVGSGRPATETRPVDAFRTLRAENGFRVVVTRGPRALEVTADDNVLPLVETVVEGDTLVLRLKPGTSLSTTRGLVASLTTDVLEGVTVSGGGRVAGPASATASFPVDASGGATVELSGVMSSLVTLTASGGSAITVSGTTSEARVTASAGSTLDTRGLAASRVTVDLSGGSQARVAASNEVTGTASGGSTLTVSGAPPSLTVDASGGSTVTRAD